MLIEMKQVSPVSMERGKQDTPYGAVNPSLQPRSAQVPLNTHTRVHHSGCKLAGERGKDSRLPPGRLGVPPVAGGSLSPLSSAPLPSHACGPSSSPPSSVNPSRIPADQQSCRRAVGLGGAPAWAQEGRPSACGVATSAGTRRRWRPAPPTRYPPARLAASRPPRRRQDRPKREPVLGGPGPAGIRAAGRSQARWPGKLRPWSHYANAVMMRDFYFLTS